MIFKIHNKSKIAAAAVSICLVTILSSVQGQTGPSIKVIASVHECSKFEETLVHPNRYILSKEKGSPFAPRIYDIQTGKLLSFPPFDTLLGVPQPGKVKSTGTDAVYERSRLKLEGKYWTWNDRQVKYYDASKGRAGLYFSQNKSVKFIPGNPQCKSCSGTSRLVEIYGRYYCDACKKYVDEIDYIKDIYVSYYIEVDLASNRAISMTELERNWTNPLEQEGVNILGVDPEGKYLYYSNNIFFYKKEASTGQILVHRFNISKRAVDWRYTINVPVRKKDKAPGTYAINSVNSPDFTKILFWEYDELGDTPGRGWLENPGTQGWILDLSSGSHFSVPINVTSYGQVFSRDGKYLILGSNQLGILQVINLEKKAEEKRVQVSGSIFKLIFSPGSKYLLSFNKRNVEVFAWPDMKKSGTIPMEMIIPGVKELLVSEPMYVSADSKYAAISILEKAKDGPWWSGRDDDGFHLLQISD